MKNKTTFFVFVAAVATVACRQQTNQPPKPAACSVQKVTFAPGKVVEFRYAADGKIIGSTITDAAKKTYLGISGNTYTFVYDADGRLDKLTGNDGSVIDVTANTDGNVAGAVVTVSGMFRFSQSITYDASGHITYFRYGVIGGRDEYGFDYTPEGNLKTISRNGNPSTDNFALIPTAHDSQRSPWKATPASNTVYWWLLTLNDAIRISPALSALSYQNNVTAYDMQPMGPNKQTYTVDYTYANGYPITLTTKKASGEVSGGTVAIEYLCK